MPVDLNRWVAGVLPLCQSLTALHLRSIALTEVPALPLLVHLILEQCSFQPSLVASLGGLVMLETLHLSGPWVNLSSETPAWDIRACTNLRRLHMGAQLAAVLAEEGQALCLPPACRVTLGFRHPELFPGWLEGLGSRLVDLCLDYVGVDQAGAGISVVHAPQLSQLRHLTLYVSGKRGEQLCVARVLGSLPLRLESLRLDYHCFISEQALIVVPASLRTLRIGHIYDGSSYRRASSECIRTLTLGLHAGLECLCLAQSEARVRLQCLDEGAPVGLRGLHVRARVVDMDACLAAEVAQRGRVLERSGIDGGQGGNAHNLPPLRVVVIGQGAGHAASDMGRQQSWPCTCGACAQCLGPAAFGGVEDVRLLPDRGLLPETFEEVPATHDSSL